MSHQNEHWEHPFEEAEMKLRAHQSAAPCLIRHFKLAFI